jgi:GT2 family glycosyltransferase
VPAWALCYDLPPVQDRSTDTADVIIVNYRSYPELTRCLESLETERARLARVLVVDHECDAEKAARVVSRYPWIQLVERNTNEGFATGVNVGARLGTASSLLILNPDCVVVPGACERLLDFLAQRPDAAVAGPRILNSDGTLQGSARRFPNFTTAIAGRSSWLTRVFPGNKLSRWNLPALDAGTEPIEVDWVSGACMIVRRNAFETIGGMDERFFLYWEDADLCRRFHENGWRVVYYPGATVVHVGGRSSIHAESASLIAFHRSAYVLFRKHARGAATLLHPFVYLALQVRVRAMLALRARAARNAAASDHGA